MADPILDWLAIVTGAERKAFAAEIGRLVLKLQENSHGGKILNENAAGDEKWLAEMGKTSGTPTQTLYRWWKSFTAETARAITPKQAAPNLGAP